MIINAPVCFGFDYVAPGDNRKLRMHWRTRIKLRQACRDRVFAEWVRQGKPIFEGPVSIRYVRHYKRIPMDKDNLYSSFKSWGDVLVRKSKSHPDGIGIIEDDRPEILDLHCGQVKCEPGRSPQTTIMIWPR